MWIKRVVINNIGPHEKLDVSLPRGLVGIFGFNGKGKTTIVDGAYAALTNDFSRFPGDKNECIRLGSSPDSESSIFVEAEHNGTTFTVFRCLRAPKKIKRGDPTVPAHELVVDGTRYTKQPEIKQQLEERLGVNAKLISTYVFVRQWGMFDFLSQTEGQRAETYQLLCGTGKAAEVCEEIDQFIAVESAGLGDDGLVDNSDELRQRIGEANSRRSVLSEEFALAKAGLLAKSDLDWHRSVIAKRTEYERVTAELVQLEQHVTSRRKDVDIAKRSHVKYQKLFSEAQALLQTLKEQADISHRHLEALAKYQSQTNRRKVLNTELKRLQDSFAAKKAPVLHPEDSTINDRIDERAAALADNRRSSKIVATFTATGTAECPTCGTPTALIDVDKHRATVQRTAENIKELTGLIDLINQCRSNLQAYDKWKTGLQQEINKVQTQIGSLEVVEIVEVNEIEAREAISDYHSHEALVEQARNDLGEASGTLRGVEGRLLSDVERQKNLTTAQAGCIVTDEDVEQANSALELHDQARSQLAGLDGRIKEIDAAVASDQQSLESLTIRLERGVKTRNFIKRLTLMRDEVFHRTKLPRAVASANLRAMEKDVNDVLEGFGSPFWAETTEDLSFTVHHPGMPGMSAQKLSGGLKGVLAIAFRTALSSLFGDLGLLSLDEPTAGMDANNVAHLSDSLQAYAAKVRGKRQVIMITHAEGLRHAFDHVIEIGPQAG